jgi:DNA-binding MarR family transcriptional regulator
VVRISSQVVDAGLAVDLRGAIMRMSRRLRREGGTGELTSGQYEVLVVLQHGPRTPGDLADEVQVKPPWMTRTVVALETLGLVRRSAHPGDGRQVVVTVTDAGRDRIAETRRRRAQWLDERLADLSPADRATLARATEILTAMNEA